MSLSRRQILRALAAALAMAPTIASTRSSYPARPVRVIVPFSPGGAADTFTRLATQKLSQRLGQQFYVENLPGAGGNIGTSQAARAAPDGYTVLFAINSLVVNPSLLANVPYDPQRGFHP